MRFILFDLDGTLVDSSQGIFRSFRYAFEKQGLPPKSDGELKDCIGPPLLDSFLRFHGGDRKRAEEGVKAYRERYALLGYRECLLYTGCKEGLSALKAAGKTLALATSKPLVFAEKILKDKGIDDLFSVVVGSKLDNSFDKKADIIAEAMRRLHAEKEACTMVGDRRQDGEGARANGVAFVGFRGGFEGEGELENAGAAYIADDFAALTAYLLGKTRG